MKNYLVLISITLVLASCSQQQFSFRKKIAVTPQEKALVKNQPYKDTTHLTIAEANNQITYAEPPSFIKLQNDLTAEIIAVMPDDTIRKKYKFDDDKSKNDSSSEVDYNNYYSKYDADEEALKGFLYALLGFFIFPPLAVKGLIHSIRGLKSRDRIVFAILGLILSGLVTLFLAFILFIIISLIAVGI
jgi:hypothetical protein